ncbi:MAG: methylenetetrahydrofolate reductase, partial [Actinomycetota bacterium]|nr:methylenetetrahydrofolate reductase [Actinomycetota bacterium]
EAGGQAVVTLTCRDRNRVVLEQELAGLAELGAPGVLCVTGDGRAPGVRSEVTQVFDLDGTRLAGMASDAGLPVLVAESPDAPPAALRPGRLLQKQRAGAALGVLNHTGSVAAVDRFVRSARLIGVTVPIVAAVSVFTDDVSAAVLQAFPGLQLQDEAVASVLGAHDPVAAGVDAAVAEARALLTIDGIVGVNVSGLGSGRGIEAGAEVKAAVGMGIRGLGR